MNGSHACSSFVLSSSSTKEAGVKSRSMRNSDQESKLKRPEKKKQNPSSTQSQTTEQLSRQRKVLMHACVLVPKQEREGGREGEDYFG